VGIILLKFSVLRFHDFRKIAEEYRSRFKVDSDGARKKAKKHSSCEWITVQFNFVHAGWWLWSEQVILMSTHLVYGVDDRSRFRKRRSFAAWLTYRNHQSIPFASR
jgi:hypothetical protein